MDQAEVGAVTITGNAGGKTEIERKGTITIAGNVETDGGLVINGDGTLTVSGKISATGDITIKGGKVSVDGGVLTGGTVLIRDTELVAGTDETGTAIKADTVRIEDSKVTVVGFSGFGVGVGVTVSFFFTVTVQEPVTPLPSFAVTIITAVPALTPFTSPVCDTLATFSLLLFQSNVFSVAFAGITAATAIRSVSPIFNTTLVLFNVIFSSRIVSGQETDLKGNGYT